MSNWKGWWTHNLTRINCTSQSTLPELVKTIGYMCLASCVPVSWTTTCLCASPPLSVCASPHVSASPACLCASSHLGASPLACALLHPWHVFPPCWFFSPHVCASLHLCARVLCLTCVPEPNPTYVLHPRRASPYLTCLLKCWVKYSGELCTRWSIRVLSILLLWCTSPCWMLRCCTASQFKSDKNSHRWAATLHSGTFTRPLEALHTCL